MPRFELDSVRRYYDRHTAAFLAFGQGGDLGAIHRAVWGPGATNRRQAFRYVEDQIALQLRALSPSFDRSHVVDLGCGTASSLCYLASQLPITGLGVTLSPVQVQLGRRRIRAAGLSSRVSCIEADFAALPEGVGTADLVYAVESFVHGSSAARFVAQCARLLRPGGLLLICDDFKRPTTDPAAGEMIERFCQGWQVNSLLEPEELRQVARTVGLHHESTIELSPYLQIGRLRDRAIGALIALCDRFALDRGRFDHLRGGSALQQCLAKGWLGYDLARFRRVVDP